MHLFGFSPPLFVMFAACGDDAGGTRNVPQTIDREWQDACAVGGDGFADDPA
jgi:hypothetical protein